MTDASPSRAATGWASRGRRPGRPRSRIVCRHALGSAEPLVIEDARGHPLVRDNLAIRDSTPAYAGSPLTTTSGHALETLCVIDHRPRPGPLTRSKPCTR